MLGCLGASVASSLLDCFWQKSSKLDATKGREQKQPSMGSALQKPPGKKKPAPKRGFRFHVLRALDQPRSCSSAVLKVGLGRMALLALATSGR